MATEAEIQWAVSYNGYERFAGSDGDIGAYGRLLQPAMREYEATGRVPGWCGVDLLQAWAFFRARENHMDGLGHMPRDWDGT